MSKKKNRRRLKNCWKEVTQVVRGNCEHCSSVILYFYKYDAFICPECNEWLEKGCNDPECMFCANRPDTPLEAILESRNHLTQDEISRNFKIRKRIKDPYKEKMRDRKSDKSNPKR